MVVDDLDKVMINLSQVNRELDFSLPDSASRGRINAFNDNSHTTTSQTTLGSKLGAALGNKLGSLPGISLGTTLGLTL
jgi:hypothetical protein